MSTFLVGISGKKGSGKSTTSREAARLLNARGIHAGVRSFAAPLKELIITLFNAPRECLYGTDEEKNRVAPCGKTWRKIMQEVGNGMRAYDEDVWVKRAIARDNLRGFDVVFFDDTRYPNEMDRLSTSIRLTRWDGVVDEHISETALDDYNFAHVLRNGLAGWTMEGTAFEIANIVERMYAEHRRTL